ncbi:DJ-1/PfpI family protein [Nocardioides sp. WG-D5]
MTSSTAGNRSPASATAPGRWSRPAWSRVAPLTSFPSIRTDLRNAGAEVLDQDVVVDGNLITSRSPDDLPAFCDTIVSEFGSARALR